MLAESPLSQTSRRFASSRKKMPPKKAVKEEKVILGRPGNSLKSGIVRRKPAILSILPHDTDIATGRVGECW